MKILNILFSIFDFHRSFTLVELLIVVGIVGLLVALAFPALHDFRLASSLDNATEEIINALRLTQNKTTASEGDSVWGIYFSTNTLPHQYTLFKGENYASRDMLADEVSKISETVLISEINLGGNPEIVFNKVSGESRQSGSIKLISKADSSQSRTIYIETSGQAGLIAPVAHSDDNRIKDSRHVHTDYSRYIDTNEESLILIFSYDSSIQTEIISINNSMEGGQFNWEGQIDAGGSLQKLKIHTHRLNNEFSGTQFSIHRDRRYNDKALKVKLSGDSSGNLADYSSDGSSVNYTSSYVTNIQWQ